MKNYELEYIYNDNFMFSKIDVTYIITLIGSNRIKNVRKQLRKYKLSKKIIIVHNYGYKKTNKNLYFNNEVRNVNHPALDLVHANYYIFKHSIKNNFNNILVLEDDFIISNKIYKSIKYIENEIDNYKNRNEELILKLGCIPFYLTKKNSKFNYILASTGTQAIIYNKKSIKNIYKNKLINNDIDLDISLNNFNKVLSYKTPLIYQTFPETENQLKWGTSNDNYLLNVIMGFFAQNVMKNLFIFHNLHIKEEPGTTHFYNYGNIYSIVSLFFVIFLIYNVIILIY